MRRLLSLQAVFAALILSLVGLLPSSASAQTVRVLPYVQPGDGQTLKGKDAKVIRWLTDKTPGDFLVEFQASDGLIRQVAPTRVSIDFDNAPTGPENAHHYFVYTAKLDDLPLNSDILYRVKLGDKVIREAKFRSLATADKAVRCVMVGDMEAGSPFPKEVAYRISQYKPEFLVALGDIVYPSGRVSQYMHHFWNVLNDVTEASPQTGAPLMDRCTFYPVLGNHDVMPANTADALGVYYFFSVPKNGPGKGPWTQPPAAKGAALAVFQAATADSYSFIDTYSFDYGPAHFTIINANRPLTSPALANWIKKDLTTTKAAWKFVCFHQPPFHSSPAHQNEQQVRHLVPLFEECGVDMTFGGHVHNYQRTVPLKFAVTKAGKGPQINGKFTLDTTFDGVKNTHPNGVMHVVAGGGGAPLYGLGPRAEFQAKMNASVHSFVVMDLSPDHIDFRAISKNGDELDHITITKGTK